MWSCRARLARWNPEGALFGGWVLYCSMSAAVVGVPEGEMILMENVTTFEIPAENSKHSALMARAVRHTMITVSRSRTPTATTANMFRQAFPVSCRFSRKVCGWHQEWRGLAVKQSDRVLSLQDRDLQVETSPDESLR